MRANLVNICLAVLALVAKASAGEIVENSIGMKLVRIPAGEFTMGSPPTEKGRREDEPQRSVRLTRDFFIGEYEVTRGQFREFVDASGYKTDAERGIRGGYGFDEATRRLSGPDHRYSWQFTGFAQTDEHPVVNVSWNDASAFCRWLTGREKRTYRLPTEAEWEHASRGGATTAYCNGDDPERLIDVGNIMDSLAHEIFSDRITVAGRDGFIFTAPAGTFRPNAFGLHDMHGNVWEWTADWFGAPPSTPQTDPHGPEDGRDKVVRGGDWYHDWSFARSAQRSPIHPSLCRRHAGFRVVRELPPVPPDSTAELKPGAGRSYEWIQVTPKAAFAPRDGAGALVFDGRMWLLGGWNPSDKVHFPRICNNEVWSSADGREWTLVKSNSFLDATFDATKDWEGRHTAGYTVHRGKMWIVGGDANQGHYQPDVWNSTDGRTWNRVNKDQQVPWGPRVLHYTVAFKDRIWVIGGQTIPQIAAAGEAFYRDIWNTEDGVHWQRVSPREPCWSARGMIGGSIVFNGRIWILGGGTYDTPATPRRSFFNDVWSSGDGINWTQHLASAPWPPRQYHDVAVFDGRMWVLEGYSEKTGNRNDVWSSADGIHWSESQGTPWKARHAASVFVHDNALWMVAGNNMEPDVWKLQRTNTR